MRDVCNVHHAADPMSISIITTMVAARSNTLVFNYVLVKIIKMMLYTCIAAVPSADRLDYVRSFREAGTLK